MVNIMSNETAVIIWLIGAVALGLAFAFLVGYTGKFSKDHQGAISFLILIWPITLPIGIAIGILSIPFILTSKFAKWLRKKRWEK